MGKARSKVRNVVEYAALRAFAGVVRLSGLRVGYALAAVVGELVHLVDRRHREIARANLREHFRDDEGRALPEREVRRIARGVFRHITKSAVEVLLLPRVLERRGLESVVDLSGGSHITEAIASGRGAILVSAHLGNWEVVGAAGRMVGCLFTTVYRPLDNPLLDRWVRESRSWLEQEMVPKWGAIRPLLKALRDGRVAVILVDQDPRGHGVFAPFFGTPASTVATPAELALRTGAAIIPGFSVRTGPGFRYTAWIEPPVEVRDTGDREADLVRITAEINRRVEAAVRRAPEQWLWAHRRWKTRPPGGSAPIGPTS